VTRQGHVRADGAGPKSYRVRGKLLTAKDAKKTRKRRKDDPGNGDAARINAVHAEEHFQDPVLAYDRLARIYRKIAEKRQLYLAGVEREILARIPRGSQSLLDIGAGDGRRALRLASTAGVRRIVLLEPSAQMLSARTDGVEIWRYQAEDLEYQASAEEFDVIICLWNVLGHIKGTTRRSRAMRGIKQRLSENGRFFMDVNHRYNARAYGVVPTMARIARDVLLPSGKNGDVVASWDLGAERISTYGHVFTHREIVRLAESAGLKMQERIVIDYDDGRVRRSGLQGNLLYVFRRRA